MTTQGDRGLVRVEVDVVEGDNQLWVELQVPTGWVLMSADKADEVADLLRIHAGLVRERTAS